MTWAAKYIGLPFREGARGPDAFDCWGLVRHVLQVECGLDIEPFSSIQTFDGPAVAAQVEAELALDTWAAVDAPRPFDVAVMWVNQPFARTLSHVGIVESPGKLLHTEKGKRAICVRFRHLGPVFQIHRFYRHKELA